jgi:four helix bundle protein
METKYDYKKLNVYIESKILVKMVYALLKKFPKEEQYALCDQLRRAVISVPSNISEGFGRYSSKEQVHFFEIAYGSLREVDCQLDIACDLGYISTSEYDEIEKQINIVSAILSGVRNKRLTEKTSNPLIH